MSDVQQVIATAIRKGLDHLWVDPEDPLDYPEWRALSDHLAEMVDAALGGLTREVIHYSGYEAASGSGCEISTYTNKRTVYRWFSKWTAEGWTPEERSEK